MLAELSSANLKSTAAVLEREREERKGKRGGKTARACTHTYLKLQE
jgi:hypothetical protein